MKSFGGRASIGRVKKECDKYVAENLNAIKYELFCEIVQDDFRQAEAVMLYALMRHGYGTTRLQRVHQWFKEIVEMPDILGKTPHCKDCQKLLTERHGINFNEITVRFESREQFEQKEGGMMKRGITIEFDMHEGCYVIQKQRGTLTLQEIQEALNEYHGEDQYFIWFDTTNSYYDEQGIWIDVEPKGDCVKAFSYDTVKRKFQEEVKA